MCVEVDKIWTKPIIIIPIILMFFLVYISYTFNGQKDQNQSNSAEARLEQTLMQIDGVGQVKVYFHYDSTSEPDSLMGDYFSSSNHQQTISGLLVVSEGASSPAVQNELLKIISKVMEMPAHRIMIVPMESKGDEQ